MTVGRAYAVAGSLSRFYYSSRGRLYVVYSFLHGVFLQPARVSSTVLKETPLRLSHSPVTSPLERRTKVSNTPQSLVAWQPSLARWQRLWRLGLSWALDLEGRGGRARTAPTGDGRD